MSGATLAYVPRGEFERALALPLERAAQTSLLAALARLNTLYMIQRAGSGHIGSSFSSLELVAWVHLHGLRRGAGGAGAFRDVYFSSKGHDAPGLYSVLIGLGLLDFDLLHRLRRLGGLPGHPDVGTPGVAANTGSLGMGISKARGMILAARLLSEDRRVFVLTGDGELQEGQFWESLQPSANRGLRELTVIVDANGLQSDTWVESVSPLGDLARKVEAFGWEVAEVDGHDAAAIDRTLGHGGREPDGPRLVIARTVKGRGVSFMESTAFGKDEKFYKYHSGAPPQDVYERALAELRAAADGLLAAAGAAPLALARVPQPDRPVPAGERLVAAYGRALLRAAERNPRLAVLDADLVLDTGLAAFAERYPARFFECGIAEQDMVSQAGGMALAGLLPVVHSFACFLSTRPNEQIYNNATERTKVIYVGSLAGLLPGGPGHSHQCVRDIAALAAVPGMVLVAPATEAETEALVEYLTERTPESAYIRLASVPCPVPFPLPARLPPEGTGTALTAGEEAVLFGYGPVLLSEAYRAAGILARGGIGLRVVNLPWLNRVDRAWLAREIAGARRVFTLDDHYLAGGQGEMLAAAIAQSPPAGLEGVTRFGVEEIPLCGWNDEVLRAHRLDAESLAERIRAELGRGRA